MTWLKGQTTWANLVDDLAKLACGEMADGAAVTVSAGDAWLRDKPGAAAGTGGMNCLRSPASVDRPSGAMSMRTGYWALTTPGVNGLGLQVLCKQTALRTLPTRRMVYRVYVSGANTVANDYSTATIRVYCYDPDDSTNLRGNDSFTPSAAGDITLDGMTLRITDPSGILPVNANFFRAFTPDFPGGIDHWPMYYRRGTAATFSTAPPGVAGTDYAITEQASLTALQTSNSAYHNSNQEWFNNRAWFVGLGIKTATGLGANPVYVYSHPMALHKLRWYKSATAGIVGMEYGGHALDGRAGQTAYRFVHGHEITTWARPFMTAAQVTDAAVISYWMSVKPDGIVVILSGDPGLTGKVSASWVGCMTPYDPNYDKFPVLMNRTLYDYTVDNGEYQAFDQGYQMNYWSQRRKQDGTEGARDWQTGWSRSDLNDLGTPSGQANTSGSWTGSSAYSDRTPEADAWGTWTYTGNATAGHPTILPIRQLKPHPFDAKWWMYGVAYGEGSPWETATTVANPGQMDSRQIRGVVNARWWYLPGDGWANLDELTDNGTSQKYLLVAADYNGIAGRHRVTTSTYMGGAAIAEL